MRLPILLLILIATLFGSGFWYQYIDTTCRTPVYYHVGSVDERFGASKDEIKGIAMNAELLWEDALHTDLFVYSDNEKGVPINLIFDERQEEADREEELRADLEAKEGMSESVSTQYEALIVKFRTLKKEYESRVVAYEATLEKYNTEVSKWNAKGGAPENILQELQQKSATLSKEQNSLQKLARELNTIAENLNNIGARGNALVTDYNSIVEKYNKEFNDSREFAQGDYADKVINIYQYDSEEELTIVLAHEFGHALSLGHVEGENSIMYYLMGKQTSAAGVQAPDITEYTNVCREKSIFESIVALFRKG
ncbi:matrixin family metalloprotease [Candidatus Kaiserbacteria bacterium]|nr:MAG: matrixin family metalloprotease [Candidatus Kaiserbacteria bacterium]